MGVVNTTYTFTGTDTITSSKLNNIIDDTTFTSDAISGSSLQVVSPGKLAVAASGITSNELASTSVTQAKLATNVVGNGPAFSAYPSSSQNIASATDTKVNFGSEDFDTNGNFASSRFTPSVAGYYLFNAIAGMDTTDVEDLVASIHKNGLNYISGSRINGQSYSASVSGLIYLNGSTDYVELYVRHLTGTSRPMQAATTKFSGCLIRSA